jgi:hypothetical protein
MSAAGRHGICQDRVPLQPKRGGFGGLRTIDRPMALGREPWVLLYAYTTKHQLDWSFPNLLEQLIRDGLDSRIVWHVTCINIAV